MDLRMQHASGAQRNANRRRFSDEQTKFLEFMFETESRPESQIKHQLANELGLQPRQISIWFQNRRARSKSKQVEKEYKKLKARHDALASSYDSLKKDNQSLLGQLQKLKNLHAQQQESRSDQAITGSGQRTGDMETEYEHKEKAGCGVESYSSEERVLSGTRNSRHMERRGIETEFLSLTDCKDGSIASPDWQSFESPSFLDESSCISQWWESLS